MGNKREYQSTPINEFENRVYDNTYFLRLNRNTTRHRDNKLIIYILGKFSEFYTTNANVLQISGNTRLPGMNNSADINISIDRNDPIDAKLILRLHSLYGTIPNDSNYFPTGKKAPISDLNFEKIKTIATSVTTR